MLTKQSGIVLNYLFWNGLPPAPPIPLLWSQWPLSFFQAVLLLVSFSVFKPLPILSLEVPFEAAGKVAFFHQLIGKEQICPRDTNSKLWVIGDPGIDNEVIDTETYLVGSNQEASYILIQLLC